MKKVICFVIDTFFIEIFKVWVYYLTNMEINIDI